MSRRVRLLAVLGLAPGLLALAVAVLRSPATALGADYEIDAAAPIAALARGDLHAFFAQQPLMGGFSLLLRAPLVALVPAGNLDAAYAAGVLACLAVAFLAARMLHRELAARWGQDAPATALVPVVALLGAPVTESLIGGHPEEPLGALLCAGAALAAIQRRAVLAGILLGLAVATKQWGAFAVLPILVAGTGSRPRTTLAAAGVAGALTLPLALGDFGAFRHVTTLAGGQGLTTLTPMNLLTPLATGRLDLGLGGFDARFSAPALVGTLSRPLMALAIVAASAALLRPRRRPEDLLWALALIFLARCALDPVDNVYYHAPLVACLAAWEGLRRPGAPVLALGAGAVLGALALLTRLAPGAIVPAAALYAAFALGLGAALLARGGPARAWTTVRRPAPEPGMARSYAR